MDTQKQRLGRWGEQVAVRFLRQQGYSILQKNFFTRGGEIDIIAYRDYPLHGRTLCFIEVKTRQATLKEASRATHTHKQRAMQRAAKIFCMRYGICIETTPIQFEHVSVYRVNPKRVSINHYVIPIY